MDASFNQIRQFGSNVPSILIRLMESFVLIHSFTQNDEQREALNKHVQMVIETAESSDMNKSDLADLHRRLDQIDK